MGVISCLGRWELTGEGDALSVCFCGGWGTGFDFLRGVCSVVVGGAVSSKQGMRWPVRGESGARAATAAAARGSNDGPPRTIW